jgi:hypothetical protein
VARRGRYLGFDLPVKALSLGDIFYNVDAVLHYPE